MLPTPIVAQLFFKDQIVACLRIVVLVFSRSCSRLIECSREKTVPTLLWHQTENAQVKMHKSEVDILSDCVKGAFITDA